MAETGKIHVYYGHGKGKTTAAVGQAVRAAGAGMKVLFFQFLKDNSSGERKALGNIPGVICMPGKDRVRFCRDMDGEEREELKKYNTEKLNGIVKVCDSFDMLILDEALCATALGVLKEERLLDFLRNKPAHLEIILTGHEASGNVLGIASYATEMKKRKHPFDAGLKARRGIEY